MKRFAILIAAASLAACTTPTIYAPLAGPQGSGYAEQRIEPGRYRVTYRGGSGAGPDQAADYALLRAAELTIRDGYDWFRVVDRYTSVEGRRNGPTFSVGGGSSSWGRRSSVGLGVGTSFDLGPGPIAERSIEVVMGRGALPPGGDVYDARGVAASISARLPRG